jgi:hypothetical protein
LDLVVWKIAVVFQQVAEGSVQERMLTAVVVLLHHNGQKERVVVVSWVLEVVKTVFFC